MKDTEKKIERIEALVQEIEKGGDPAVQGPVRDLLQMLLELHGSALSHILEDVYRECGQAFIDRLAEDELIGSVLLLHGLHPLSRTARVANALEDVKPYLASHGGNVELVDLTADGTVILRLEGSCHGCPSSQATLKYTIEEAVYAAAPDVRTIEIDRSHDGAGDADEFIPMNEVQWDDCPFPASGKSANTTISTKVNS